MRGGTAALSLTQSEGEGEDERVRGLLVTTDNGKHWRTLLAGGIRDQVPRAARAFLVGDGVDSALFHGHAGLP
ncbi:hypothetical protein [Streptomyces flaveus]|uniref:Uncharacterized protein n=1 Tax=Streptomyces flaveus TaxID=66370 RepID=A0A917RMX9_9ACTN|nr:hypothetical protein [Streptomyces flaveus]GGL14574.1 hypothetical protein GCM10010094_89230 [Streptomyces flaveus]